MISNMKELSRMLLSFTEHSVKLIVPISAIVLLYLNNFSNGSLSEAKTLDYILAIVAGIAISEGLSRLTILESIKNKIESLHDYDIPNQKLLEMAHQSGIVGLSPRHHGEWLSDIISEINKSKQTLYICGVALPSLREENKLTQAILRHAEKYDVRILLLDPDCPEAERRLRIESPHETTTANIRSTIKWLKVQMANNYKIRCHLYDTPPMLALFITENHCYVEPYHFGKPKDHNKCIGGHVPLIKIKNIDPDPNPNNSYSFFNAHFTYMWNISRGNRVNLLIYITEFEPGSHITLKNVNDFDINMQGWSLASVGILPGYQFKDDFIFLKGAEYTIKFSASKRKESDDKWNIDYLEKDVTLAISNREGVLVSELKFGNPILSSNDNE